MYLTASPATSPMGHLSIAPEASQVSRQRRVLLRLIDDRHCASNNRHRSQAASTHTGQRYSSAGTTEKGGAEGVGPLGSRPKAGNTRNASMAVARMLFALACASHRDIPGLLVGILARPPPLQALPRMRAVEQFAPRARR